MATISGEVRDENNDLLADCVVRAYRRDTGALLVAGVSGDGSEETVGDEYYASVLLLLNCDGEDQGTVFTDASPNPVTVTAYGGAHIQVNQVQYGSASAYFDGTDDYLTTDLNDTLAGDFNIECWINLSNRTKHQYLFSGSTTSGIGLAFNRDNAPGVIGVAVPGGYDAEFSGTLPANDTWFHFALCRSGTDLKCFINGEQYGATKNSSITTFSLINFRLGQYITYGLYFFGYIDEFRITKGAPRYTSSFTPPSAAFPASLNLPPRPLGEYTLTTTYTGEVNVIALDPAGGTNFNDLILRTTPV